MTRRDYVLIAEGLNAALRLSTEAGDDAGAAGIAMAAGFLAGHLAADNARFDRDRFMAAVEAVS